MFAVCLSNSPDSGLGANIKTILRSWDSLIESTLTECWIQLYSPGTVEFYNILDDFVLVKTY